MIDFFNLDYLHNKIIKLLPNHWYNKKCFIDILDYTIQLFSVHRLDNNYYGYHNINHGLEVTYITMLFSLHKSSGIDNIDLKYLYVAALLHDFDPIKSIDKPHENNVIKFLSLDKNLKNLLIRSKLDFNIIKILILRTTYPCSGKIKYDTKNKINKFFTLSNINKNKKIHIVELGKYLSMIDRISGYVLGDFNTSMEKAKKNAHALAWHPSDIVKNTIIYFENILNNESSTCNYIFKLLPIYMKKNFISNVLSFVKLRRLEIQIKTNYVCKNIEFISKIEKMKTRQNNNFIKILFSIYLELPKPLQFEKTNFSKSIKDPNILINTLRLQNTNGRIIGFARGGPLENYKFRQEINDENNGLNNTIFLEPLSLKMGYWGLHGGNKMRELFIMQAKKKKFIYLTSFALRQVIKKRIHNNKKIKFVTMFNPERWDYYRIML